MLLHVDDSRNDRLLVQEAISLLQIPFLYYGAGCFEEAIPHFASRRPGAAALKSPFPALVLLDYDFGNQTGLDFLYWLRFMKEIKSLPVVMFSGSPGRDHIANCYAGGADYYLEKPATLSGFKNIVQTLHRSLLPHSGPCPIAFLHEYRPNPSLEPEYGLLPGAVALHRPCAPPVPAGSSSLRSFGRPVD